MANLIVNFTVRQLIQEVKRLANQNPDFVYQSCNNTCFYTRSENNNDCGCIFGQAILNLQPDLKEKLQEFDNSTSVPRIHILLKKLGMKLSLMQKSWCAAVQSSQDRKCSWSHAIQYAERFVKLHESTN